MVKGSDVDEVSDEYFRSVNMSYSELLKWSNDPCSRLASLDRGPINRNLHLLSTPPHKWGDREVRWAKKTISFNARMKEVEAGAFRSKHCRLSRRTISLKNWAFDPNR